jgi:hypothetical protein
LRLIEPRRSIDLLAAGKLGDLHSLLAILLRYPTHSGQSTKPAASPCGLFSMDYWLFTLAQQLHLSLSLRTISHFAP